MPDGDASGLTELYQELILDHYRRPRNQGSLEAYTRRVALANPTCGDELINLPAIHGLTLFSAGERLDMEHGQVCNYVRRLDLRTGRLTRSFTWHTRAGAVLRVAFERFISAARRHVMALRCLVQHVGGPPAELRFIGALSAEVRTNGFNHFAAVDMSKIGNITDITTIARVTMTTANAACAMESVRLMGCTSEP